MDKPENVAEEVVPEVETGETGGTATPPAARPKQPRRHAGRAARRVTAAKRQVEEDAERLRQDEAWMAEALAEARRARDAGEVPIGAVVVHDGRIVGRGFNQPRSAGDPTAHAELLAIREAARTTGNYRLTGATLYVTIEPCLMCVGALVHARVARLVFGAPEARTGAVVSTVRAGDLPGHNHKFEMTGGIREDEARQLMREFFAERR